MSNILGFQSWAYKYMLKVFGPREEIAKDRSMRFFEEAIELAQATGLTKAQAMELVDYVYARPIGEPHIEAGDVLFTLAGLASVNDVCLRKAASDVNTRAELNAEKIAAKRKKRPTDGSALPTED